MHQRCLRFYQLCQAPYYKRTMTSIANTAEDMIEIREGCARMLYNKNEAVFYNKIQVFNRDISIQVIRLFADTVNRERKEKYEKKMVRYSTNPESFERQPMAPVEGISILDALAATGLRSVRYLKEIPGVRHVTINDLEEAAVAAAEENCRQNYVEMSRVSIHHGDASMFMYEHRQPNQQFDVVDLDPYGTASPFLDSAVQAVSDGGLLCVTCTDMPTLAGNYPEVCFAKYGCVPLKAHFVHEMSLRILLHAIDSAANKYKRHIVPWVSISVDFYVRVFVRVFECPAEVKRSALKRTMVYQSVQCPSFYLQPVGHVQPGKKGKGGDSFTAPYATTPTVCEETGARLRVGGPFWGAPIHDQVVVDELLRRLETETVGTVDLPFAVSTSKRIIGVLTVISEEVKDAPFYVSLSDLASAVRSKVPTNLEFYSALLNAGYTASNFHHEVMALKTNAPMKVLWDIMRAYCKLKPPEGSGNKKPSEIAQKILSKDIETVVDFTPHESLLGPRKKVIRFAPNPEEFWGPKRRAGRLLKESTTATTTTTSTSIENGGLEEVTDGNNNSSSNSNSNSNSNGEDPDAPQEKKSRL